MYEQHGSCKTNDAAQKVARYLYMIVASAISAWSDLDYVAPRAWWARSWGAVSVAWA